MMKFRSSFLLAASAAFLLFGSHAYAQQTVLQGGTWTVGHFPIYAGSSSSNPVVIDSGVAPAVINTGQAGQIPWYATTGTALSGNANLTISSSALTVGIAGTSLGSLNLTGSVSGTVSILPQGVAGTYNFNLPVTAGSSGTPLLSAGGGGSAMTWGSLSGNTSKFATVSGAFVTGHCVVSDSFGNLADNGSGCGGSGTVNNGSSGQFSYYAATGTAVSGSSLLSQSGTTVSVSGALSVASTGGVTLTPSNANVVLSPTGTGVVTIEPATAGTIDNIAIGNTTRSTGKFSTLNATTIVSAGSAGASLGSFTLSGNTSGTITIQPQAAAGTYNFNIPNTSDTSGQPLLSGGGGTTAMSWGALSGNTSNFATVNGALTSGHCVSIDASGNIQDSGSACATGSGTVNSGTSGQLTYYASSTNAVSGNANANISGGVLTLGVANSVIGKLAVTGSSSGTITIAPQAASGTYNFNLPTTAGTSGQPLISAGGGSSPMAWGSLSGNTTTFATKSGAWTTGNCVSVDASGNLVDNGTPCGSGGSGTVVSSTAGQLAYYPTTTNVVAGSPAVTLSAGTLTLGTASTTQGQLNLIGSTSGTVSVAVQNAAGTYNFNLPTTPGTAGQVLISGGGGASPMTWGAAGLAAVTTQTSDFNANANGTYCVDTVTGAATVTATLPASPSNNDTILFLPCSDYSTYSLVIGRNGNTIQRIAANMTVSTDNAAFHLTFVTSYGWIMW